MIVGTCPTKVFPRGPSHHGLGASGGYEEVKPCVSVSAGLGSLPVGRERRLRDVRTSHAASERRERGRVTGREGEGGGGYKTRDTHRWSKRERVLCSGFQMPQAVCAVFSLYTPFCRLQEPWPFLCLSSEGHLLLVTRTALTKAETNNKAHGDQTARKDTESITIPSSEWGFYGLFFPIFLVSPQIFYVECVLRSHWPTRPMTAAAGSFLCLFVGHVPLSILFGGTVPLSEWPLPLSPGLLVISIS